MPEKPSLQVFYYRYTLYSDISQLRLPEKFPVEPRDPALYRFPYFTFDAPPDADIRITLIWIWSSYIVDRKFLDTVKYTTFFTFTR